jgi:hypothetical protein
MLLSVRLDVVRFVLVMLLVSVRLDVVSVSSQGNVVRNVVRRRIAK